MEGFLICTGKRTNQPLFIYETKMNIFSAEELCYYIYENIETLDEKLFDVRMLEFLKRCDREDISLLVETILKENGTLEELVRAVFSYVNYYGKAETEQLCVKVKSFANQPVEERLKAVGDTLLKNKKYSLARKQYRRLLEMGVNEYMDNAFYGKIWHNLGVTYARALYFKESIECFRTAYDIYPDDEIKMSLLKALRLTEDKEYQALGKEDVRFTKWHGMWNDEENALDRSLDEEGEVKECIDAYKRGQVTVYNESVGTLIDKWKKEYREQMK